MPWPKALAACFLASTLLTAARAAHPVPSTAQDALGAPDLLAELAQATSPAPLEIRTGADAIAAYGGLTRALVATDDALYMAQGLRIETADLADAAKPRFVSTLAFTETVAALDMAQGYLVAAVGARLVVLDLADPLRPAAIADLALSGPGTHLAPDESGALLYVAHARWDEPAGIDLVDLATPSVPLLAGHIDLTSYADYANDLAIGDGALYVAAYNGLLVFDVRSPTAPLDVPLIWNGPSCCFARIARIDDMLYAVHDLSGRGITLVSAIDLTDPLRPQYQGGTGTNTYEARDLIVHDGWLIEAWTSDRRTSRIRVLGGSSGKSDLGWEGTASMFGFVTALAAHGDFVYGATNGCGLSIFRWQPQDFAANSVAELAVAGTVPLAGTISAVMAHGADAVVVGGPRAACNRIDHLDLADPARPRLRSITPLQGWPEQVVGTRDGAALVLPDSAAEDERVRLWNGLQDPATLSRPVAGVPGPVRLAFDERTGNVVAVSDPLHDYAEATAWLIGADGSARRASSAIGFSSVRAVAADGGRLAVVGTSAPDGDVATLGLFDSSGRALGTTSFGLGRGPTFAVAMDGPAVYVAGTSLSVYDIATAGTPRFVTAWAVRRGSAAPMPASLDTAGGHLAFTDGDAWLFDISNRLRLRPLIGWKLDGRAEDVAILGAHVLVAAGDAGLLVLPILPAGWRAEHAVFAPAVMAGP